MQVVIKTRQSGNHTYYSAQSRDLLCSRNTHAMRPRSGTNLHDITPAHHQIKTAITDRQLSPVTKIMKIQILSLMLMAVSLVLNESLKYRHKNSIYSAYRHFLTNKFDKRRWLP